ncbi:MAG: hypothetical protein IJT42_03025 [Treponema sp.]|nr:hypothetical protein [Treponema sp.]
MKKIISAIAIGAMVAGGAFAELKVSLNYRNGAELFKYVDKGMDGRTTDDYGNTYVDSGYNNNGSTTTFFNLTGWNSGKDSLGLTASGDIFTVKATLQPTIASNNIILHIFDASAKLLDDNLTLEAGWNGDGIQGFRVNKFSNDGNEEGKVGETFKLGSLFTGSIGLCANNQISFNTGRNYFARADYRINVVDGVTVNVAGNLMFDREWDTSSEKNDGNLDWSIFIDPKINDILNAELFVKSGRVGKAGTDKVSKFVTGGYVSPKMIPLLKDSAIGGSVVILDGKLIEYNADWRFRVDVSSDLMVTYFGKFAKLSSKDNYYQPVDGAAVGALAGLTGFNSSQALWNMVNVRYKINNRFTGIFTVGELTDLDDGFHLGRQSADGTQLYAYPHVQIYASKGATVQLGAVAAFGGIGAHEDANKDIDVIINIPVMFRVKM